MTKRILEAKLLAAVECIETAANQTTDEETFKILTVGFNKIQGVSNAKQKS